jgi:hypothetical protein
MVAPDRTTNHLLQRRHVQLEGGPPGASQSRRGARPLADEPLADLDVADLLQGGQLLGQGRVGQAHTVADELEVGPLRGRQQGDDGQPGRRVDQLVEPRRAHRADPPRSLLSRIFAMITSVSSRFG